MNRAFNAIRLAEKAGLVKSKAREAALVHVHGKADEVEVESEIDSEWSAERKE